MLKKNLLIKKKHGLVYLEINIQNEIRSIKKLLMIVKKYFLKFSKNST